MKERTCYTCRDRKPVDQFITPKAKTCTPCRQAGRARQRKADLSARTYSTSSCEVLARNKRWKAENADAYRAQQREATRRARAERRAQVLAHYGDTCACCSEPEVMFLTVDHIEGNGNEHRRQIGKQDMWRWLVVNGFPPGFRILCFNCNAGRYRNGGRCPHEGAHR